MLTIDLLKEVGLYCKERTDPNIPRLFAQIKKELEKGGEILFSIKGVRIITPSFIDQLLGDLAKEYGPDFLKQHCKFDPALPIIFKDQFERSARLRGWKKVG